ncbi:OmpA/MotB family protein [Mitsuokella jalaludinii]|uniref:OmpA/MotB family protein n=1 Tax=Mitsuokella jalaludinii TaxID=187979 RepID=UPI003F9DF231
MLRDKFGFNFWPSFTDLMLSFVLIVLIILFVVSKMLAAGSENLDAAKKSQEQIQTQIQNGIDDRYKVVILKDENGLDLSKAMTEQKADVYIIDKLDRQTITFSDKVLFDTNESELKPAGQDILWKVGPIIANNLDNIVEIQVQGHADINFEDDYNLNLAAQRAMAVYKYLQFNVGIDPAKHLMSATSFGRFKPVGREAGDNYDYEKIQKANATEELMARNRRIEIVIFYKNAQR